MLVDALGATQVSVGENFRFGHRAQGDPELLRADERFETRVVPLVEVDGEIVSSSHIRGLVAGGAVEYAGDAARRAVRDRRRGRRTATSAGATLGFPTANLVPRRGLRRRPATASTPAVRGRRTGAGTPPPSTSACARRSRRGRGVLIEAYLIDFDGDLYGQQLRLEFLKRLRGEKRFDERRGAVEQMERDVEETRMIAGPSAELPARPATVTRRI